MGVVASIEFVLVKHGQPSHADRGEIHHRACLVINKTLKGQITHPPNFSPHQFWVGYVAGLHLRDMPAVNQVE
jgi:hypothetical protein